MPRILSKSGKAEEAIDICEKTFLLQEELSDNQSYIQTLSSLAEAYLTIDKKEKTL